MKLVTRGAIRALAAGAAAALWASGALAEEAGGDAGATATPTITADVVDAAEAPATEPEIEPTERAAPDAADSAEAESAAGAPLVEAKAEDAADAAPPADAESKGAEATNAAAEAEAKSAEAKSTEAKSTEAKSTEPEPAKAEAATALETGDAATAPAVAPQPTPKPKASAERAAAAAVARLKGPAKRHFGAVGAGYGERPAVYGGYAKGCIAGAMELARNGSGFQAMRLSRNRRWGHPSLLAYLKRLGERVRTETNWPGMLVGDMAQPIGGPMLTGHASHQSGLDVDIWFTPMPARTLSAKERETLSARNYVASRTTVTKAWTGDHRALIRLAAEDPAVARIFVNAAIKRDLCEATRKAGASSDWLRIVRPWYGHADHLHVRLKCPKDSPGCVDQAPPPPGDGCDQLAWWFSDAAYAPSNKPRRGPLTVAELPKACSALLAAVRKAAR